MSQLGQSATTLVQLLTTTMSSSTFSQQIEALSITVGVAMSLSIGFGGAYRGSGIDE